MIFDTGVDVIFDTGVDVIFDTGVDVIFDWVLIQVLYEPLSFQNSNGV